MLCTRESVVTKYYLRKQCQNTVKVFALIYSFSCKQSVASIFLMLKYAFLEKIILNFNCIIYPHENDNFLWCVCVYVWRETETERGGERGLDRKTVRLEPNSQ